MKHFSIVGLAAASMLVATLALPAVAQTMPGGSYPDSGEPASPGAAQSSSSSSAPTADFKKLDTNKDGYISKQEAKKDKELSKLFDSIDANHDGKLDPSEFSMYMGGGSGSMGGTPSR